MLLCLCGIGAAAVAAQTTQLQIKSTGAANVTQDREAQTLDFRYAPARWQSCIGLPDDPHKSIVGSDGGLYYDYGGGRFHDFNTRILASIETDGEAGDLHQRLHDARTPIVITEQTWGDLTLEQSAWARVPEAHSIDQWAPRRADYLWLKMVNRSNRSATGQLAVQIDPKNRVVLNRQRSALVDQKDNDVTFATMSPACKTAEYATPPQSHLVLDHKPGTPRNWARPTLACHRRFRDIFVGSGRPLIFTYAAEPQTTYYVCFGLIEGWHGEPGIRPLELRIEGKVVRTVDLIGEFGKNHPVVLGFDARDLDNDGRITIGVHSPAGAKDTNTILSGLWVFDGKTKPDFVEILKGDADERALALADINAVAHQRNHLKLLFGQKTLAPGQEFTALLTFNRGGQVSVQTARIQAQQEYDRAVAYWRQADLPYDRIVVPDDAVQDLLDSCIRNIYQAREIKAGLPAFQVGPTCYRGTWAADGPFILEAVTYLGRAGETRAGLEQQVDRDQGPGGVAFSKKSGLRLWMIWRHAQLTGDRAWLEAMWPRVQREVSQIVSYRRTTMSDPDQANYGLMPIGFGDGGLGGRHREYTNVYWTLAGLKAAIEVARQLDKDEQLTWEAEFNDYWRHFEHARNRDKLTDKFGNTYVPVTMKGEAPQLPQRGSWAFLQSIFPGRIFPPDDKLMQGTMAMLEATQREGLIYGTGWLPEGIWNYAASFYGHAELWLGRGRKAASILYAFANHASPLLSWREEQNLVGEAENYCGDMPHNWASAEFIRLVRHLMVLERGQELHLLEGMPVAWTHPGQTTKLKQIPTSFGDVSLRVDIAPDGQSAKLTCTPPTREPVERLVVHTESFGRRVKNVHLGNRQLLGANSEISTNAAFTLTIEFDD